MPSDSYNKSSQGNISASLSQANMQPVKILLVGDTGVGKTALVNCLLENTAPDSLNRHAGYMQRKMLPTPSGNIDLTVFDVQGGYANFEEIGTILIRQANAILFVYDVTDKDSFAHITEWIKLVQRTIDFDPPYFLIGTKADLSDMKVVDNTAAAKLAAQLNMQFIETSAKTGLNVQDVIRPYITTLASSNTPVTKEDDVIESKISFSYHSDSESWDDDVRFHDESTGSEPSFNISSDSDKSIDENITPEDQPVSSKSLKK